MNDLKLQRIIKEKAGSDGKVVCRYVPKYPIVAEREYIRMTDSLLKLTMDELKTGLPKIKEAYKKEYADQKIRTDSIDGLDWLLILTFNAIKNRLVEMITSFGLIRKLLAMSALTRKLTISEWKNAVHHTLGIDIREDYYLGEWFKQGMKDWTARNVELIKTIPTNMLDDMKEIVRTGFNEGKTTTEMMKEINKCYDTNKKHARFIARDQVAKLNAEITKTNQEDAGVTEYIWDDSGDERVRESHRRLSGTRQRWDEPPETDGGRHCHPGEDFQCRCVALPVFDLNVKLPWEAEKGEA